jgi:hypothetical protein
MASTAQTQDPVPGVPVHTSLRSREVEEGAVETSASSALLWFFAHVVQRHQTQGKLIVPGEPEED